jgi:hypothetical protein
MVLEMSSNLIFNSEIIHPLIFALVGGRSAVHGYSSPSWPLVSVTPHTLSCQVHLLDTFHSAAMLRHGHQLCHTVLLVGLKVDRLA